MNRVICVSLCFFVVVFFLSRGQGKGWAVSGTDIALGFPVQKNIYILFTFAIDRFVSVLNSRSLCLNSCSRLDVCIVSVFVIACSTYYRLCVVVVCDCVCVCVCENVGPGSQRSAYSRRAL